MRNTYQYHARYRTENWILQNTTDRNPTSIDTRQDGEQRHICDTDSRRKESNPSIHETIEARKRQHV